MMDIGEAPRKFSFALSTQGGKYAPDTATLHEYTPGQVKVKYDDLVTLFEGRAELTETQFFSARTEDFLNVLKAWGYTVNE